MILGNLGEGVAVDELLDAYPYLEREDVLEAMRYAAWLAQEARGRPRAGGVRIVVDMNLSPDWTSALVDAGHDAVHWCEVGRADAADEEILRRARAEGRTILTSDLDFEAALATSGASAPSVIQLRTATTLPSRLAPLVARVLRETEADLFTGALVTVADDRVRLRSLIFIDKP